MLEHGKYSVVKNAIHGSEALEEDTFFVLRAKDVLATMTLRSYVANALQLLDWGYDPTNGLPLTEEQKEHLSRRADGAHLLAEQWAGKEHKVPD